MIKAVPYIQTTGSERFKNFLTVPFTIDMLYPVFNEKSRDTIFDGWIGKDMLSWHRFTNDEKIVLEFYADSMVIKKEQLSFKAGQSISYRLPLPRTINNFINVMDMFNVQLYWSKWVDDNFEPKEYMDKEEISKYFTDLLTRMGKSHELQ